MADLLSPGGRVLTRLSDFSTRAAIEIQARCLEVFLGLAHDAAALLLEAFLVISPFDL
jgi:hypothetical protein